VKKYLFILTILLILIFLVIILINKDKNYANPHIVINGKTFEVEIAKTEAQKQKGLAKYNKISDNFAMEFPFEKASFYAFWMKDMKFSIDIIYISKNKIVQIFKNVPSPKSSNQSLTIYKSSVVADTVLEINGNLSQKYNFNNGTSVKIEY
jgi:uncharacterized membrane protein (UPF0127 family)